MIRRRSIRFRLTAWYAAILSVALGLFGGLVWFSLRSRLVAEIDGDLANRAAQFEKYFKTESAEAVAGQLSKADVLRDELDEFSQALPPGSHVSVRGATGFTFSYPAKVLPRAPEARFRVLRRQFELNGENFDLEVRAPMDGVLHTLELLRFLLLGLIPVVIAIACVGGAWLSGRALKPVHDIAAAALTISIENLSARLPVPETGDEIARLTEVLNTMLGRLESAVRTLSQFVADASHELRTPLTLIRTTAELGMRRSRPAEDYRDALREIAAETERMTQLVEDLLILARSDTGTAEMPLEPVDVGEIVEGVCAEMRRLAELRQMQIKMMPVSAAPAFGERRPATIAGNRPALHRLFLVLLDNALKYSDAGSEVTVTVNVAVNGKEPRVAVSVENFGTGISQKDMPHIFKRFYRADRVRGGDGYGLGLSLAQSIARSHGAVIEARSGEGSTAFEVAFPLRQANVDTARQLTTGDSARAWATFRQS
jgi:two-component system, OmpR family, heavy metal sensor histidine kinase CusS